MRDENHHDTRSPCLSSPHHKGRDSLTDDAPLRWRATPEGSKLESGWRCKEFSCRRIFFRIEVDPANVPSGSAYRISDVELASRLSFFLWSSNPDDELLDLAERGRLKDASRWNGRSRMLADPRAKTLVSNFVGQWLYLRNVDAVLTDRRFQILMKTCGPPCRETDLFFESMLREDRSLLDLLRADYTFVNDRLARHYGMSGIHGTEFRRVTLTNEERKGLLGKGSVLTVTSSPEQNVADLAWKICPGESAGLPSSAAPAERAVAQRRQGSQSSYDAGTYGAASGQSRLLELPLAYGSAGLCARKLRRPWKVAERRRLVRSPSRRHQDRWARRTAAGIARQEGPVCHDNRGSC